MPRLTRLSLPNVAGERGKNGSRRRVWAVPIRCWPPGRPGSCRERREFAIRREHCAAALYPMGLPVQPNLDAVRASAPTLRTAR
jgi:hypothetical protein